MNIFLIDENVQTSCKMLAELDLVRARKQLLECCQLLATVQHVLYGRTTILKANGEPYGKAHPHHPITKNMLVSYDNLRLCLDVTHELSRIYPTHACSVSYRNHSNVFWYTTNNNREKDKSLCVCRKNHDTIYVNSRKEYAELMKPYFMNKVNQSKNKEAIQ